MKKFFKKGEGFTLIELLVVVAIIGLLSTLSMVALNSARMKSRDARRVADIKQIQTALELLYAEKSSYPSSIAPGGNISTSSVIYMGIIPSNPLPWTDGGCHNSNYAYTFMNANSYNIWYCLGASTGGIAPGAHVATPSGIADP